MKGEYRWEKPADFDIDLGEAIQGEGLEWFESKIDETKRLLDDSGSTANIDTRGQDAEDDETTIDTGANGEDYLRSQPQTGRSIYAWEELVDEETDRTYCKLIFYWKKCHSY